MKTAEDTQINPLIIENSHLQGPLRKISQRLMTLLLWMFWFYLMLPMFGFSPSASEALIPFITPLDTEVIIGLAAIVGLIIVGLGLWMGLWAQYNIFLHRFKQHNRCADVVRSSSVAKHFHVSPVDLAVWQREKQLLIKCSEQGSVQNVMICESRWGHPLACSGR